MDERTAKIIARKRVCMQCPERGHCQVQFTAHHDEMPCQHWPAEVTPGLLTLAKRLTGEVTRWVGRGAPKVTPEMLAQRTAACEGDEAAGKPACAHWDAKGHRGLGMCKHPLCGCTRWKRHLLTSHCPMGKWEV